MAINSLKPLRADQFDYGQAQHLLNRAGFGGTPSQIRAVTNMGLADAVLHSAEDAAVLRTHSSTPVGSRP